MSVASLGVQSSFMSATTLPTAGLTTVVGGGTKTFVTDCTGLPQGWSSSYSTGSSADVADSIRRFSSITHIPNALSRRAAFFLRAVSISSRPTFARWIDCS